MHESEQPRATDDAAPGDEHPVADTELDSIAADLDTVEAAMKALDADAFDEAEALTASLGGEPVDAEPDEAPAAPNPVEPGSAGA